MDNEIVRDEKGRFLKGSSGNVLGKPVGLQNRYNEYRDKLFTLLDDVDGIEKLKQAIQKSNNNRELMFLFNTLTSMMPKEMKDKGNDCEGITSIVVNIESNEKIREEIREDSVIDEDKK